MINGWHFLALTFGVFAVIAAVGFAAHWRGQTRPPSAADNRRLHTQDTAALADEAAHRALREDNPC